MQQNDLISGVEWLPILSSKDLGKLIRDAMNGIIKYTINGSSFEINVENLGRPLVQHIMKDIVSSLKPDEQHFKYLLSGLKLLHTLWNIASHHSTLARVKGSVPQIEGTSDAKDAEPDSILKARDSGKLPQLTWVEDGRGLDDLSGPEMSGLGHMVKPNTSKADGSPSASNGLDTNIVIYSS
ncbi:putative nodulin homeobox protein [Helianthus annuus]|nr:putative nodulin homeobox protein [Helianthus annuus]